MAKMYTQVLLFTTDGIYSVSVPKGEVELNDKQHIAKPQEVFENGSSIVAVEIGKAPKGGPYTALANPAIPGSKDVTFNSDGPRTGTFIVQHKENGQISLRHLGEMFFGEVL